jgi:RNA polymerase sigma-70 factor (ECF subfamily)
MVDVGVWSFRVVITPEAQTRKLHRAQLRTVDLHEQSVLSALRDNQESALEMLFRTYYTSLCRYAYSFLHDRDEAEEVVQQTFLGVWDRRQGLSIQTSIKAYLYTMVRNSCLNVIKHDRVKQVHELHAKAQGEPVSNNASELMIATELESRIYESMKALPEQCRLVFQLSRFEQLSYAEIATQLNISVKTVENQIGKALKIMRSQLKEYLPLLLLFFKDWF